MNFKDTLRLVEEANASTTGHDLDAFHGTTKDFDAFDPDLTGDIGLHFGTAQQADKATRDFHGDHHDGANIIPVKLRLKNPLRVKDMFSILRQRYIARAKTWTLDTPGFLPSQDERDAIYDAASAADRARGKAGGDYGVLRPGLDGFQQAYKAADRLFWNAIKASCIRQGYDGLVYDNKSEGKGDSYVVFDAAQVRVRHASFDPEKTDSTNLLDHARPSMRDAIALVEAMTRDEAACIVGSVGIEPERLSGRAPPLARNRVAKTTHPDQGGVMGLMRQLNAAHDVLKQVASPPTPPKSGGTTE